MRIFLIIFLCVGFFSNTLMAQKTSIALIDFFIPSKEEFSQREARENTKIIGNSFDYMDIYEKISKAPEYALSLLTKDDRFNVVDRSNLGIVENERELQKSEAFIDGYVTPQYQKIGADYLLLGDFEINEMVLILKLYSVATQTVVASETLKLKLRLTSSFMPIKQPIEDAISLMINKVMPAYITVVESQDEKGKRMLIAAGHGRNLKAGDDVEFKKLESKSIDGKEMKIYTTIAKGEIEKVEDDNFSIVKLKSGQEVVLALLKSSEKVYAIKIIK